MRPRVGFSAESCHTAFRGAPCAQGHAKQTWIFRTLPVWWEFIWRNVVYSVILRIAGSIALSMTIGILAALGGPMRTIVPFVSQVLMDGAVGLFVIYSGILDEEFGDFRVTLVPRAVVLSAAPAVEPAPNSLT